MKKLLLLLAGLTLITALAFATPTAKSTQFADSYLMRVQGCEALYWNPALLSRNYHDILIPGINQTFYITNNSFDLDAYNWLSGRYLTTADKQKLMKMIDEHLMVEGEWHAAIFGITFSNMAFATSLHSIANLKLSKDYLRVLLYGNEQDSYIFTRNHNQFNALAYQDMSIGFGDIALNRMVSMDAIPDIKFGASGSLLLGYGIAETTSYHGDLVTSIDGLSMHQDVEVKSGSGGLGGKLLFSLASEPVKNVQVGISLDNLMGNIHWYAKPEQRSLQVAADSIYAANLDEDMFSQADSVWSISGFDTPLPAVMRIGGVYKMRQVSFSLDWIQGFKRSQITSPIGRWSLGAEFLPIPQIHLRTGLALGNQDYPWRLSYGCGFKTKFFEIGCGLQSIMSVLPGNSSKGISFSTYVDIPY